MVKVTDAPWSISRERLEFNPTRAEGFREMVGAQDPESRQGEDAGVGKFPEPSGEA